MNRTNIAACRGLLIVSMAVAFGVPGPAAGAADAAPAPTRAPGLWELKHAGAGGTVIGTQTLCVSAASEAKVNLFGQVALNVNCSKYATARNGAKWSFEFACGPKEMQSISKGTVSGNLSTSYNLDMTESDGTIDMARTIQATHKGACPAGVKPGDLRDETGKTVTNILD